MCRSRIVLCTLMFLLSLTPALAASPPPDMHAALQEAALTACNPPTGCPMTDFLHEGIAPGIVHYSAILQTGPGVYDRIGIHRVVRENRAGYPLQQADRIFLQHGGGKTFTQIYLPGTLAPSLAPDFGIASFLAQNRVDVWGIDLAWTMVPAETVDFGFMAQWDLQRQVDDLRTALAVAREVREIMGGSGDRFNLLGYSTGASIGMAVLNHEAGLPRNFRHVQGYVVADMLVKTDSEADRLLMCQWAAGYQLSLDSGQYAEYIPFQILCYFARSDPAGPSPFFEGMTNMQAALGFGAYALGGGSTVHYAAGEFDEYGLPTGLQYISTATWLDFLDNSITWEPIAMNREYTALTCNEEDLPYDDLLGSVRVPIYYWGAAGGAGEAGLYTLDFVQSRDKTSTIVRLWPEEDVLLDFAHVDLFMAENAPAVAWPPLLEWIQDHR